MVAYCALLPLLRVVLLVGPGLALGERKPQPNGTHRTRRVISARSVAASVSSYLHPCCRRANEYPTGVWFCGEKVCTSLYLKNLNANAPKKSSSLREHVCPIFTFCFSHLDEPKMLNLLTSFAYRTRAPADTSSKTGCRARPCVGFDGFPPILQCSDFATRPESAWSVTPTPSLCQKFFTKRTARQGYLEPTW